MFKYKCAKLLMDLTELSMNPGSKRAQTTLQELQDLWLTRATY